MYEGDTPMRVMILAKSTPDSEHAEHDQGGFDAMGQFTRELVDAGLLLDAGGLQPSSRGAKVRYERKRQTIIDGPFTEAKELVAGFWIWQVQSLDEALEWLKRAPFPEGQEIEVRPVLEPDALGATAESR